MNRLSKALGDLSITQKFVGVSVSLLLLVAVFITLFFPARQESQMRAYVDDQANTLAQTLAAGVGAGMFFEDASSAEGALASLQEIQKVPFALVFSEEGSVFASYQAEKATTTSLPFGKRPARVRRTPTRKGPTGSRIPRSCSKGSRSASSCWRRTSAAWRPTSEAAAGSPSWPGWPSCCWEASCSSG